ncbi:magnesium transporter 9 [Striga asiatica]|uniref:Magnesium transporter 9 n=1 Tax=Striga asiatica TaxID=4170 RepID=A0A5A7PIY1_STRAF|nr:magnesium transporter 9 [Striga asiatica]
MYRRRSNSAQITKKTPRGTHLIPTNTITLLAARAVRRIIVRVVELIVDTDPIVPRLRVVGPVHRRVGPAPELPQVHLERGSQVYRRVHAARGNWQAESVGSLARAEEGADVVCPFQVAHREMNGGVTVVVAVEEGEDGGVVEGERGVPVEAEAAARASAGAGGHGGVGDAEELGGVVDGGDWVAAGVGGEGELLVLGVACYVGLEARVAAAGACAERVLDLEVATFVAAGFGGGSGEEEEEKEEECEGITFISFVEPYNIMREDMSSIHYIMPNVLE